MAITPQDLLEYAESLILESGEIRLRNAAGRAFYAAVHACRPIYNQLDAGPETKEGTHQRLIRIFKGYFGGADEEIARRVRALGAMYWHVRDLRQQADYEIESEYTMIQAQGALDTAKRILERTAELSSVTLG